MREDGQKMKMSSLHAFKKCCMSEPPQILDTFNFMELRTTPLCRVSNYVSVKKSCRSQKTMKFFNERLRGEEIIIFRTHKCVNCVLTKL